ncbi:uncharacterized protein BDR25DRAFT_253286, partial [Lindgomyces ingoldianus]
MTSFLGIVQLHFRMKGAHFFSFGFDDSYISKSLEGVKYRNLPPRFHQPIASGNVSEVYTAALGPLQESWVIAYRDSQDTNRYGCGNEVPSELRHLLQQSTPTPHLRVFMGPLLPANLQFPSSLNSFNHNSCFVSYMAWDSDFVRWRYIPDGLERALQSWLTPAGWKYGPPRTITWGPLNAHFAMSEYGEVDYQVGWSERCLSVPWPSLKETIEEWNAEVGFQWSDLAYISLSPTTNDEFIVIRNDGTWAGAVDDSNEEALESFVLNFFSRARRKGRSRSKPS